MSDPWEDRIQAQLQSCEPPRPSIEDAVAVNTAKDDAMMEQQSKAAKELHTVESDPALYVGQLIPTVAIEEAPVTTPADSGIVRLIHEMQAMTTGRSVISASTVRSWIRALRELAVTTPADDDLLSEIGSLLFDIQVRCGGAMEVEWIGADLRERIESAAERLKLAALPRADASRVQALEADGDETRRRPATSIRRTR